MVYTGVTNILEAASEFEPISTSNLCNYYVVISLSDRIVL